MVHTFSRGRDECVGGFFLCLQFRGLIPYYVFVVTNEVILSYVTVVWTIGWKCTVGIEQMDRLKNFLTTKSFLFVLLFVFTCSGSGTSSWLFFVEVHAADDELPRWCFRLLITLLSIDDNCDECGDDDQLLTLVSWERLDEKKYGQYNKFGEKRRNPKQRNKQ